MILYPVCAITGIECFKAKAKELSNKVNEQDKDGKCTCLNTSNPYALAFLGMNKAGQCSPLHGTYHCQLKPTC